MFVLTNKTLTGEREKNDIDKILHFSLMWFAAISKTVHDSCISFLYNPNLKSIFARKTPLQNPDHSPDTRWTPSEMVVTRQSDRAEGRPCIWSGKAGVGSHSARTHKHTALVSLVNADTGSSVCRFSSSRLIYPITKPPNVRGKTQPRLAKTKYPQKTYDSLHHCTEQQHPKHTTTSFGL